MRSFLASEGSGGGGGTTPALLLSSSQLTSRSRRGLSKRGLWSFKKAVFSMAPKYRFQYKVTIGTKKYPLAPALTRRGARERGFATQLQACLPVLNRPTPRGGGKKNWSCLRTNQPTPPSCPLLLLWAPLGLWNKPQQKQPNPNLKRDKEYMFDGESFVS